MSDPNQPGSPKPKGDGPTAMFRLKLDGWMEELIKQDLDAPAEGTAEPPAEAAAPPAGGAETEEAEPKPKPKMAPPGFADAPGFATKPVNPPKR